MEEEGERAAAGASAASDVALDARPLGAAASKTFAAGVGDVVVVFSRSPAHRHYSIADIEWMVLPAVASGQFHVTEYADAQKDFRAPIAVVTWAFVSGEVDRRLEQTSGRKLRLRPDEWTSGSIGWLVDAVGGAAGVKAALQWLSEGPFKERTMKAIVHDASGAARVATLEELAGPTE
jgi:hemolysin-activating ACP:hemolysin acyltransferase